MNLGVGSKKFFALHFKQACFTLTLFHEVLFLVDFVNHLLNVLNYMFEMKLKKLNYFIINDYMCKF